MPHLWINSAEEGWGIQKLAGAGCLTVSSGLVLQFTPPADGPGPADVRLLPPDAADISPSWTLLGGRRSPLRVNGQLLALGIRALCDRDEISLDGQRCFFSTEDLANVVSFPGLAQLACCPRCKQTVEPGTLAVACPHCHAWHHQSEMTPCWTYDFTCALCHQQATALDTGFSWTPEML